MKKKNKREEKFIGVIKILSRTEKQCRAYERHEKEEEN